MKMDINIWSKGIDISIENVIRLRDDAVLITFQDSNFVFSY